MAELEFSAEEWAAIIGTTGSNAVDDDPLAALIGTPQSTLVPTDDMGAVGDVAAPTGTGTAVDATGLTAAELAELWATAAPAASEVDPLAALVGDSASATISEVATTIESRAAGPTPETSAPPNDTPRATPQPAEERYSWIDALHLIPKFERLVRNYPPITTITDPKHGRVIILAYLEDKVRGIQRNFKIGRQMFFDVDELERVEPDTKSLKCRILIKIIPYEVGLKIRCWEHRPGGDDPQKKGVIVAKDRGLAFEERPAVLVRGAK